MSDNAVDTPVQTEARPTTAAPATQPAGGLSDPLGDALARGPSPRRGGRPRPVQAYGGRIVQFEGTPGAFDGVHAAAAQATAGPGQALPHRARLEAAFGTDLGHVRAHVGPGAQSANQQIGAKAFATGDHVAFATPSPDLHTAAHEVAHTFQQKRGVALKGGVGAAGDRYEREADAVADQVVRGESVADAATDGSTQRGAAPGVQLKGTPNAKDATSGGTEKGTTSPAPKQKEDAAAAKGNKMDVKVVSATEFSLKATVAIGMFNIVFEAKVALEKVFGKAGEKAADKQPAAPKTAPKIDAKPNKDATAPSSGQAESPVIATKIAGEIKVGAALKLLLWQIGLRGVGTMEAELEGDRGVGEAVKAAVTEFTKWRMSDEVEGVTRRLKDVTAAAIERVPAIAISFDQLIAQANQAQVDRNKLVEESTTENAWFNPSRTILENIRKEAAALKEQLQSLAGMNKAADAEKAAKFFFNVEAISARVRAVGQAAQANAPSQKLVELAKKGRADTMADVFGSIKKAQEAIKAADFKVPTPGVKVKGGIGVELFVGTDDTVIPKGAPEGEFSFGVVGKFDTGRTKKEKDPLSGKDRDVFDKSMETALTFNAKIAVGPFSGSLGLTMGSVHGKSSVEVKLDTETEETIISASAGYLNAALGAIAQSFKDAASRSTKAMKDQISLADEGKKRGVLTKTKDEIMAAYARVKPTLEAIMMAKGPSDPKEFSVLGKGKGELSGKTKLLAGGSITIGPDGNSGSIYVGTGKVTEADLTFAAARVKGGMLTATKLTVEWTPKG